jgi:hypothetical protein
MKKKLIEITSKKEAEWISNQSNDNFMKCGTTATPRSMS